MVGRVLGADGAPLTGLTVQTVETAARTDDEGRFTIAWQDPNQHVHFTHHDVWFQRRYRAEDAGRVVDITLPAARDAQLRCGEQACAVTLSWPLGPGYEARVSRTCVPGATFPLAAVPRSTPSVSCRGAAEQPTLDDRGDALVLEPPLAALRVELRAVDGALPSGCRVHVGSREGRPAGEGFWAADIASPSTVSASCAGRPARPVLAARDAGTVTLEWSAQGPEVDVVELAPWAATLTLAPRQGDGWTLRIAARPDGTFALPPLTEGVYAIRIDGASSPTPPVEDWTSPEQGPPGTLKLDPVEGAEALVGLLTLEGDLLEGAVPVEAPSGGG